MKKLSIFLLLTFSLNNNILATDASGLDSDSDDSEIDWENPWKGKDYSYLYDHYVGKYAGLKKLFDSNGITKENLVMILEAEGTGIISVQYKDQHGDQQSILFRVNSETGECSEYSAE